MRLQKKLAISILSGSALLATALSASADNEVKLQKITWVKPTVSTCESTQNPKQELTLPQPAVKAVEKKQINRASVTSQDPIQKNKEILVQKITWITPQPEQKNSENIIPNPAKPVKSASNNDIDQTKEAQSKSIEQKKDDNISNNPVAPLMPNRDKLSSILSKYYGLDSKIVAKAFQDHGYTDDALVTMFMANASNADISRIETLRRGNSWKNVICFLQLDAKYLFQNLHMNSIPKEGTRFAMSYIQFINWREDPEFRDLGDLSVRELVGASLLVNRFHSGPLEALKEVRLAGSAINALGNHAIIE